MRFFHQHTENIYRFLHFFDRLEGERKQMAVADSDISAAADIEVSKRSAKKIIVIC